MNYRYSTAGQENGQKWQAELRVIEYGAGYRLQYSKWLDDPNDSRGIEAGDEEFSDEVSVVQAFTECVQEMERVGTCVGLFASHEPGEPGRTREAGYEAGDVWMNIGGRLVRADAVVVLGYAR